MKIKIDTENKTIQLEQSAKLTELFALIKKLFPNDEWKQYSIEAVTYIYNWNDPITIPFTYTLPYNITIWETTKGQNTFCIQTN